ncbi:hypothetical protein, partial [Treponema saccharophilum]|uniref:hypothetical protein n=1 Tax=Treponema saccharophilum TaxID=165 RepID=UPI0038670B19
VTAPEKAPEGGDAFWGFSVRDAISSRKRLGTWNRKTKMLHFAHHRDWAQRINPIKKEKT